MKSTAPTGSKTDLVGVAGDSAEHSNTINFEESQCELCSIDGTSINIVRELFPQYLVSMIRVCIAVT